MLIQSLIWLVSSFLARSHCGLHHYSMHDMVLCVLPTHAPVLVARCTNVCEESLSLSSLSEVNPRESDSSESKSEYGEVSQSDS